MELKDIKAIIDLMKKNDLSVFELERDGFKLKLQKGAGEQTVFSSLPITSVPVSLPAAAPASASAATATAAAAAESSKSAGLKDIVSPMVGTFYRAGSPESPSFAEIGKQVTEETVVCIIEAMKVMNEIKAETTGVIAEIVAENEERNAWQESGGIDSIILFGLLATFALAVGTVFVRAAGKRFDPPFTPSAITAIVATLTALLVVYRTVQEPGFDDANTVEAGAPLAVVALALIALAARSAMRAEEEGTAWVEPEPAPSAAP